MLAAISWTFHRIGGVSQANPEIFFQIFDFRLFQRLLRLIRSWFWSIFSNICSNIYIHSLVTPHRRRLKIPQHHSCSILSSCRQQVTRAFTRQDIAREKRNIDHNRLEQRSLLAAMFVLHAAWITRSDHSPATYLSVGTAKSDK